jgi:hypothetical protein
MCRKPFGLHTFQISQEFQLEFTLQQCSPLPCLPLWYKCWEKPLLLATMKSLRQAAGVCPASAVEPFSGSRVLRKIWESLLSPLSLGERRRLRCSAGAASYQLFPAGGDADTGEGRYVLTGDVGWLSEASRHLDAGALHFVRRSRPRIAEALGLAGVTVGVCALSAMTAALLIH